MAEAHLALGSAELRLRWQELFLKAFAAHSQEDAAVAELQRALRSSTPEERHALGVPEGASDLELYEYILREGAALLLSLEKA